MNKEVVIQGGNLQNHYLIQRIDNILLSIADYKSGKKELNDAWIKLTQLKNELMKKNV